MKFYDSMGFESEHGIWVRRVDAAAKIDEAQMAAVNLSLKLSNAETRIRELEAALTEIAVGLLPDDGAAGHQQRYELCASRLCAIARDAIRSTSSDAIVDRKGDPT